MYDTGYLINFLISRETHNKGLLLNQNAQLPELKILSGIILQRLRVLISFLATQLVEPWIKQTNNTQGV